MRPAVIASTLSVGVLLSCLLLAGGLIAGLSGLERPASLLIQAGIAALLLTPLVRVAILAAEFIRTGETPFVLMTIGVLFLIVVSVLIGLF